jgi:hypothetical protein
VKRISRPVPIQEHARNVRVIPNAITHELQLTENAGDSPAKEAYSLDRYRGDST